MAAPTKNIIFWKFCYSNFMFIKAILFESLTDVSQQSLLAKTFLKL